MGLPTLAHVVYIPFVLMVGLAIGFVLGGRAAQDAAAARAMREQERAQRRAGTESDNPTK